MNNKITKKYFLLLIKKYLEGKCSLNEKRYMVNYYESFQNNKEVNTGFLQPEEETRFKILNQIKEDLNFNNNLKSVSKTNERLRTIKRILTSKILRYAAIFIIALGIVYSLKVNPSSIENIVINEAFINSKEITLRLANGNIEVISENGDRKVLDANGEVVGEQKGNELNYQKKRKNTLTELIYNELNVPHGKRFDLILSDGTKVKLNAGSSIKYPVEFIEGETRTVYMKGEAYFDVTEDKKHPFIVNTSNLNVEVLGTEFNLSYYSEYENINTVLIEGSVKLYKNNERDLKNKATMLTPGYKAAWNKTEENTTIEKVDVRVYTAWKDGNLIFKNTSFNKILKKLERKFNVTIRNKYLFLDKQIYTASFLDNEKLDDILNYFKEETSFNFLRENDKVTIITNNK